MKKFLAIVLSLAMILSFSAVAFADEEMALTIEAAGEKGDQIDTVAYIPMSTTSDYFLAMSEAFTSMFADAGFETEYSSPDFDPVRQQEILENYVTLGYDCIVVFPINAASINSAVEAAREQGVKVICQVNMTDECDGWIGTDALLLGNGAAQLAADWVDEMYPDAEDGSIKAAIFEVITDDNNGTIAEGCDQIRELSSKLDIVTTVSVTEETEAAAQQAAENLYITNPDVQVIICNTSTIAMGVDAYLTSMSSPIEDLSQVAIFTTGSDNTLFEMVKSSAENESVIRGVSSYAPMMVGAQILTNIVLNLSNGIEGEENFQADPQYLLTAKNIDAYLSAG